MKCSVVLVLLSLIYVNAIRGDATEESDVVVTLSGPVRGTVASTQYGNKKFVSFKGIPYAKPPVGALRFKPPVRHERWTAALDATQFGSACPQLTQFGASVTYAGDEDCLFLNVYAPANADKLPVMFYVHGGGYTEGSADDTLYGPDFLVNEDVVLVTVNYRLGVLGFATLGSSEYSGNMGLKDQVLALRWVNENIESFGGDAQKVTIFGHSAGGGAAHLLTLSPATERLFQRAIIMSGCAYNPWAVCQPDSQWPKLYSIANVSQSAGGLAALRGKLGEMEAKDIVMASSEPMDSLIRDGTVKLDIYFAPVVEDKSAADPVFVQQPTSHKGDESRADLDLMFGHTNKETMFLLGQTYRNPPILREFNEKFNVLLPTSSWSNAMFGSSAYKSAQSKIRTRYFGSQQIGRDTFEQVVDMTSDIIFRYGLDYAVQQELDRPGKTYYYTFTGEGSINVMRTLFNLSDIGVAGASHADELCYLFRCKIFDAVYGTLEEGSVERQMIGHIASSFANFARTGNPQPTKSAVEWRPAQRNQIHMMEIGSGKLTPHVNALNEMADFWTALLAAFDSDAIEVNYSKGEL